MSKRECPKCKKASTSFTVYGTLVTGEVSVRVGNTGIVQAVGPVKPTMMVKPGKELSGKFRLTCGHCQHSAPVEAFHVVEESTISGQRADTKYTIDLGWLQFSVPIRQGELDAAQDLFAARRLTWESGEEVARILQGESDD